MPIDGTGANRTDQGCQVTPKAIISELDGFGIQISLYEVNHASDTSAISPATNEKKNKLYDHFELVRTLDYMVG